MSELINYSTGTTVPANWLNRTLLREEGKAAYVIYKAGSTIYAKSQLPAGIDYSGSDAATVFRQATTNLASTGGLVFVRAGTYTITTDQNIGGNFVCVPLYSNTHLVGEGDSTVLKLDSVANLADNVNVIGNINFANGAGPDTNIRVANLQIDGNKTNRATSQDSLIFMDGSSGFECANCLIDHVYAHDSSGNCFEYRYTGFSWIRDSYCLNNGRTGIGTPSGIYFPNTVHDTEVSNVVIANGAWRGIKVDTSSHLRFVGCQITGCADNGMTVANSDVDIDLVSCRIENNTSNGFWCADGTPTYIRLIGGYYNNNATTSGDNISLQGSQISLVGISSLGCTHGSGVYAANLTDAIISGSIFKGNNNDGVRVDGTSTTNMLVTGNRSTGNSGRGVQVLATPTGAVNITANDLSGNGGGVNFAYGGSATALVKLYNNQGWNPQGWATSSPSVPSTGVDQQNTTGYPVNVYITGLGSGITAVGITDTVGTLTSFTRTGEVGDVYWIDVGGKIRLTYTGSPTWKWYGL